MIVTAANFATEADMLSPISAASLVFAGHGTHAFYEVASMAGVPDVVFASFDQEQLLQRVEAGGMLTDAAPLAVVMTLAAHRCRCVAAEEIASLVALSRGYTAGRVLPALREVGWVDLIAPHLWGLARPFRSVAQRLVAVEAKLKDWRRGLGQATRLSASADAVWLVLDGSRAARATAARDIFVQTGVGLAALNAAGQVGVLVEPYGAEVLSLRREILAERVAAMYVAGLQSGPVPPVFGKQLLATTGLDPRLAGAAAH